MQNISFIKQTVSDKKIFKDLFFENLPFLGPQQPIKRSDQDEGHLKCSALLNKHFSKNKNETAEIANFYFSHYKSMETESCHSNQSSYLTGTKNNFFVEANARMYAKYQLHKANSFSEEDF